MGNPIYHFGPFSLSPVARELRKDGQLITLSASAFDCLVYLVEHRERPVGKDELISAVWGRVDVSDSLVAQTIVRLRRILGDAGNEQHSIKTIARVGYRWMPETSAGEQSVPAEPDIVVPDMPAQPSRDDVPTPSRKVFHPGRYSLIALLLIVVGAAGYMAWRRFHPATSPAGVHFDQGTAIVLPAEVNAPEDWKWLHFGLMDLISNRLRDASIPTETSQAVLDLLKENGNAASLPAGFALVIETHVSLNGENWLVHLDAKGPDGKLWKAESSSSDVLKAARAASDVLLAQLGYGVKGEGGRASGNTSQELLQRIDAARLAGQPAVARELISKAPAELRASPEMAYTLASIDCDEGKSDVCKQELLELLKRLPDKQNPVVHGKILTTLALIYSQQGDTEKSLTTLTEAIGVLQEHGKEALATAFLDRAYMEQTLWRLDEATADLGRARVTYALSGDAVGAAKADFEMGLLAERRAQPDAAIGLLQRSYDQFQQMGMRSMLPSVLDGMANAQKMLLRFNDELVTTDRFWPLDAHDFGFIDRSMRRELTMVRAIALADNGRSNDAVALGEALVSQTQAGDDPGLLAETRKLLAEIALVHGDYGHAEELAASALTPSLEAGDQRDYASTWLTRISALQHGGRIDDAHKEMAGLTAWQSHLSFQDDWVAIYVMRAKASQLWSEGHHDASIDQLKQTMAVAEKLGVPELIVSVGEAYALALLDAGRVDQAMAVSGRLSIWSTTDWRAAWVEARVYLALGQSESWNKVRVRAQQLAGDQSLPSTPGHFEW